MEKNFKDYFQPHSVTWWAGTIPVLLGAFIASEPVHNLTTYVEAAQDMTRVAPAMLINGGIGVIAARAAIGRKS